jgi:transposase InsO family protein
MPRCPTKDYTDRGQAIMLHQQGMKGFEIAKTLRRPERWVRRTLVRYNPQVGLESLRDRSSRPHHSPRQTSPQIEKDICEMKQAHPHWGRRQICKQLRWQWRQEPQVQDSITPSKVRRVLARHPELTPLVDSPPRTPPRHIDYGAPHLMWGADFHETKLADGSKWQTLHWIDQYSRYELGQASAPSFTESMVIDSLLATVKEHGLPYLVKTDRDKLFYEATSGLPALLTRVLATLNVQHVVIPRKQPWWNGIAERCIQTLQQEVELPSQGDPQLISQGMEAVHSFYNHERCHSACGDQPPVTRYQVSSRPFPAGFDLAQVPITLRPTVVTRQVQASGRVSLAAFTFPFSSRYAGQAITVTVDGWSALAQASDGWQRTWDLHPGAKSAPSSPLPPVPPPPLSRKVDRRGCITVNRFLYYLGIAWTGQTVCVQPEQDSWSVALPDGSVKILPNKDILSVPPGPMAPSRLQTPPRQQPGLEAFQTRRVTRTGQISFHHRLYYAGIAHRGQLVLAAPIPQGLAIYTMDRAWITTCPWRTHDQPDKPVCPT